MVTTDAKTWPAGAAGHAGGGVPPDARGLIDRPLIIVGAPRSGTTMLFQALSAHPALWSLYRESQPVFSPYFPVAMTPGSSAFVGREEVDDKTCAAIVRDLFEAVGNVEGTHGTSARFLPLILRTRLSGALRRAARTRKKAPIRIVEKTPENCFRLQVLRRVFPEARFVYVVRDPRGSIASILHGWHEEQRFRRYPMPADYALAGYDGREWCFGLIPGWEDVNGAPLVEVCARQWITYNEHCMRDLPAGVAHQVLQVRYEELASKPGPVLEELARWADLDPAPLRRFSEKLPVVNTWSRPREEKWHWAEERLGTVTDAVLPTARKLGYDLKPLNA